MSDVGKSAAMRYCDAECDLGASSDWGCFGVAGHKCKGMSVAAVLSFAGVDASNVGIERAQGKRVDVRDAGEVIYSEGEAGEERTSGSWGISVWR